MAESVKLNKPNAGGKPQGGAPAAAARNRQKETFSAEQVNQAERKIVAVIGYRFAKKNDGNTYFNAPGALGYMVQNKKTGEIVAMTREEAVNLSVQHMKANGEKSPLFFDNAVHSIQMQAATKKVTDEAGNTRVEAVKDAAGNEVKRPIVSMKGINGLVLINENMVADGRAMNSQAYSSKELQQKAQQRFTDIIEGKVNATKALKELLEKAPTKKSTRSASGGAKPKSMVDEVDNFMKAAGDLLSNVEAVKI